MSIRVEVVPFVVAAVVVGIVVALACRLAAVGWAGATVLGAGLAMVFTGYMLFFFRDPHRKPPGDDSLVLAGADGIVARVTEVREDRFLNAEAVRISIFLTLFDVHVNRAPLSGRARFLGYYPGKRFFTFQEKSSEFNQHNAILIEGSHTRCLVKQIVGPVCRRVVYWLDHAKEAEVRAGDRIGMMKFGSRLDMIFPRGDVTVLVKEGDRVRAGETVVGRVGEGERR